MADVALNIVSNISGATEQMKSFTAAMKEAAEAVRKTGEKASSTGAAVKSTTKHMSSLGKNSKAASVALTKFVKSLGRIAFYRAIRTAIRYVSDAFKDGLKSAYEFSKINSGPLANSMDKLKKSSGIMTNQLGAAFGSLLVTVTPILLQVINLVTRAADAITQLFSALNGQVKYKKAVNAIDDVGSSASGAAKKIKGLLASWDELNVIGSETGGGGGSSGTNYSDAFDYEDIDLPFTNFANEIINAVNKGNWREVGATVASKLNDALDAWKPEETAQWISEKIRAALQTAIGFLQTFDFFELGQKIATFLSEIDWDGIVSDMFELIGSAFGALGSFIVGLFKTAISNLVEWWNTNAFNEAGEFTLAGLLEGIANSLRNIDLWIQEHIFKPFIDGFKAAFRIHSPSEVMEEQGDYIGLGILEGIAKPFREIGTWLQEHIVNPIKNFFAGGLLNFDVDITANFQGIVGAWNSLKSKTATLTAKLAGTKSAVFTSVKSAWETVKTKTSSLTANLAGTLDLPGKLSTIKTAWSNVKTGTKTLTAKLAGTATKTFSGLKSSWEAIKTKTSNLTASLSNGVNMSTLGEIKGAFTSLKEKYTSKLSASMSLQTGLQTFVNAWNSLKDKALELKASLSEKATSAWNSAVKAWNGSWLAKSFGKLPSLASGGIAYGDTLALVGEYAGASSNPEVIAPLSDLVKILGDTNNAKENSKRMAEQNTLLQEQNKLLTKILQKELVISPSASLGQVVARSNALYGRA